MRISASARIRASIALAAGRATWQAVSHGRIVSGASTLTMQLARLLEPRPRTLGAKLAEMGRALQIEQRLSKDEILGAYLTFAPYGGNLEGVRAASLAYFGKEPRRLTDAEAALLVALPQAPETVRPDRFPHAAKSARDKVLRLMLERGLIDARALETALAETVPETRQEFPLSAPHLADRLRARSPSERIIQTSIDGDLQRALAGDRAALPVAPRAERDHRDPGGGEQDAPGARLCRLQRFLRQPPLRAERHGDGDPLAGLGAQALHLRHGVRRAGGASRDHDAGCARCASATTRRRISTAISAARSARARRCKPR